MSFDNNPFDDATDYNYFRNGPTKHGTFVGTCKNCGIIWEFENYEVMPVPYPHGTVRIAASGSRYSDGDCSSAPEFLTRVRFGQHGASS